MTIPPGLLGPHPKYAVVPMLLAFGLLGWIAANNPAPSAAAASAADAVAVMAMKPIEGRDEAPAASASPDASVAPDADRAGMIRTAAGLPVEVLYGVPSAATMHLWSPRR